MTIATLVSVAEAYVEHHFENNRRLDRETVADIVDICQDA